MSNKPETNDNLDIYIKDKQIAHFMTGVNLDNDQIKLLNKLTFEEIIKLKPLFDKICYNERKIGRKEKVINASVQEIEALHDSGMSYIDIAQKYNVSISKLSKWLRNNRNK